jgi:RNA polymerase sigma-70 factor (ECF subfamily)
LKELSESGEMTFWNRARGPEALRSLPDESLCREVRAGSHEAFLVLFDRYWQQVFRMAYAVIRDAAEAEDLAQTLFLEVHRSLLQFDSEKGSFRTLLLRYAYTRAIDQRRRLASRRFYSNVNLETVQASSLVSDPVFSSGLSIEEATHLIERGMKRLDEKQRATVHAYFFRGLSLQEIADELGDSFGNARHHLYRGIANMRKFVTTANESEETGTASRSARARSHARTKDKSADRLPSEVSVVRARTI